MHRVLLVAFRVVGTLASALFIVFAIAACYIQLSFPDAKIGVTDPGVWPGLVAMSLLLGGFFFMVWTDSSGDSHLQEQASGESVILTDKLR